MVQTSALLFQKEGATNAMVTLITTNILVLSPSFLIEQPSRFIDIIWNIGIFNYCNRKCASISKTLQY